MIPAILGIAGHVSADLGESAAFDMMLFEELPHPIVATFTLIEEVAWNRKAAFFIHVSDVVDVMHVGHEAPHAFWDFIFSSDHCVDGFGGEFADRLQLSRKAIELDFETFEH